jgi:AcrR family transcriptional regulator
VFFRDGFENVSVEQITGAAGLSRGAFYLNFTDKDDLALAVIEKPAEIWPVRSRLSIASRIQQSSVLQSETGFRSNGGKGIGSLCVSISTGAPSGILC